MNLKNWSLLLLLSVLWGGSFFFVEIALAGIQPLTLVFLRVFLASIVLSLYLFSKGKRFSFNYHLWGPFFVMALLNNVIPFSLLFWGQTHVTASVASILNGTMPIFTILLGHFLTTDEKLSANKAIGVIVGFAGVIILMLPTIKDGFTIDSLAQIAILGAASSYALAGIWGKRMNKNSPLVNVNGMLICSSLMMLPICFLFEDPLGSAYTPQIISAVLCLSFFSTVLAYILYFTILSSSGATNLSLVTFLIPITAMILGTAFLNEVIHPLSFLGMAVIFISLIVTDGRISKLIKNTGKAKL